MAAKIGNAIAILLCIAAAWFVLLAIIVLSVWLVRIVF